MEERKSDYALMIMTAVQGDIIYGVLGHRYLFEFGNYLHVVYCLK